MEQPIRDIISRRLEYGLGDLLLAVYDSGYCAALGAAPELTAAPHLTDLLTMLAARHRAEVLTTRGWLGLEPPIVADELPGWLLTLPQRADPVRARATAEREKALGDAEPPDGVQP